MTESGPVLGFDSSGPFCAAALRVGDKLLWEKTWEGSRGQAEHLFPLLEEGLHASDLTWRDVTRIGVGTGPGNFTGIRIAVSAARGLALSLGIPAVGVSRLQAQVLDLPFPVLSCVSAPRSAAYVQIFSDQTPLSPKLYNADDLQTLDLPAKLACVGADAEALSAQSGGKTVTARYNLADAIARMAQRADAALLAQRPAPLYLRSADAAPASDPPPKILTRTEE